MFRKNATLLFLSVCVFYSLFSLKYLIQLDSVYFFKEAYVDLVKNINIWSSYNSPFGGVLVVQWLYPVTFLAGFIGKIFNLDWNILVRLFFYLPSIFLSIYSIQKLAKSFNFGNNGKFLMSLVYIFNTYFILLIDGGQLGVMLAYSILPLAIESIVSLSFFRTIIILSLLAMFDPRFFLMAIFTGFLLNKLNLSKLIRLIPILLIVLLICSYWLLPILKLGSTGVPIFVIPTFVSNLKLTSIMNALFLYQPHWPNNVFGKITYPNIYFLTIPILLVVSFFTKPSREKSLWMLFFLSFSFLVKGETDPLGSIYSYIINNFSVASAFRDSTKFFAPLIIVYSLIVSRYYDEIKNKYLNWFIPLMFIIPLIPGLVFGNHNNLKGISSVSGMLELKTKIKDEGVFTRTVYIPTKPQIAYQTENNQAVDGRVLVDYLPFAADNYGSEDRFNFMLRNSYINYFRALGIKNIVHISKEKTELKKIDNPMPKIYYIDRLAVVIGSPIEVEKLVPEYGTLFLEDGMNNLSKLLEISSDKIFFYLNNKVKKDLIISGLKNKFIDPSISDNSNWAKYSKEDYLTWKYQLLIRGIDTRDINFNNGVILSTVEGETSAIKVDLKSNTKYKIFIRSIAGDSSKGIKVNNVLYKIPSTNTFSWIENNFSFDNETIEIIIKNNGGFNVIGAILIIEETEYNKYLDETNQKLKNYKIFDLNSKLPESKISFDQKPGWLILNQSYNDMWNLGEKTPVAINSMTNGFFVEEKDFNNQILFTGQKVLDLGVKISLASILALIVSYFGYALYKKHHKITIH